MTTYHGSPGRDGWIGGGIGRHKKTVMRYINPHIK